MSLRQRIEDDIKEAMRAKDRTRSNVLRMIKAKMQEAEVKLRSSEGRDVQLDDEAATAVIAAYGKQRRESIESYRKGGREDLATGEEAELAIVQAYLPEQMDEEAVRAAVRDAIAQVGATSPRDMGNVMKAVMPMLRGAADGKVVNRLVRELLAGD